MASTALVWFRNDLRLADNPALHAAAEAHESVLPVFVLDEASGGDFPPGAASRWWLHHALESLARDLSERGLRLTLRIGATSGVLADLARAIGARDIYFNRRYEPSEARLEADLMSVLRSRGIECHRYDSTILHDVDTVRTTSGDPYRVFTPFWRRIREGLRVPEPLPVPRLGASRGPAEWPDSRELDSLELLPKIDWAGGLRDAWDVSESAAHRRLDWFADQAILDYPDARNHPDLDGTSRLSPYLRHGLLSITQVWRAVTRDRGDDARQTACDVFLSELGWREFAYHLLHHFPHSTHAPLRPAFSGFEWSNDREALERWQTGRTGYPIIDAGMRQLWETGWMHNRVRMIVASFLTKDLLIPWQDGAAWFWDTLVDADLANNTLGWQWSAGSGADAQPFFRVFNPVTQGKRFDPHGGYVRRWLPELENLPDRYLHEPWKAPDAALISSGNGRTYPDPIVDHAEARARALEAYRRIS